MIEGKPKLTFHFVSRYIVMGFLAAFIWLCPSWSEVILGGNVSDGKEPISDDGLLLDMSDFVIQERDMRRCLRCWHKQVQVSSK